MKSIRNNYFRILLAAIVTGLSSAAVYVRWFRHGLPRDVLEALHESGSCMLVSLDPDIMESPPKESEGKDMLHGCRIPGRLALVEPNAAFEAIEKMDRAYDADSFSSCFRPRHALETRMTNGRWLELLVCFEYSNLKGYIDGKEEGTLTVPRMDAAPLNRLLKAGGVPLPRQPD